MAKHIKLNVDDEGNLFRDGPMVPVSPPSSKLILSEVVCLSAHKIAKDSALMACPLCCIPAPSIPPHSVLLRHFQLFRARSRHAVTMLLPRVCSTINCHPLDRRLLQYSCLANVRIRICMCIYIIGYYRILQYQVYNSSMLHVCVCTLDIGTLPGLQSFFPWQVR